MKNPDSLSSRTLQSRSTLAAEVLAAELGLDLCRTEVGFLLQRMESFHGIAILTTSMRSALDESFERRHVAFAKNRPVEISASTNNEITLHDLSELFTQFSEFPVYFQGIQEGAAGLESNEAQKRVNSSHDEWGRQHVESPSEDVRGMLTKLRSVNTSEKVTTLISSLMRAVTAQWCGDVVDALTQRLIDTQGLDWPRPSPSLRPPAPEHPKMPPLYQPRGDSDPQIANSTEEFP